MSRSKPELKNPADIFCEWKGGIGELQYYNREYNADDPQSVKNVVVKLPFSFLVLDQLNTITGGKSVGFGKNKTYTGYWANEVRDTRTDLLTVKSSHGEVARGTYQNIKDADIRYCKSIYIAYKDEHGELVIGNIQASGSAVTAWIEFCKTADVEQCAVSLTRRGDKETSKVGDYYPPVFQAKAASAETDAEAKGLDGELQKYLASYLPRNVAPVIEAPKQDDYRTERDAEINDSRYDEPESVQSRQDIPEEPPEDDLDIAF